MIHHHKNNDTSPFMFSLRPDGNLQHTESGLFVHPRGGKAKSGIELLLHPDGPESRLAFNHDGGGCFRHRESGMFVHPKNGKGAQGFAYVHFSCLSLADVVTYMARNGSHVSPRRCFASVPRRAAVRATKPHAFILIAKLNCFLICILLDMPWILRRQWSNSVLQRGGVSRSAATFDTLCPTSMCILRAARALRARASFCTLMENRVQCTV